MVQRKACVTTTAAKPNELSLICSLILYLFFGNKTRILRKAIDQYFIHCISSENLERWGGSLAISIIVPILDLKEIFGT